MNAEEIQVLHVDDEPALTELVAEMLKREDDRFAVETATSADEGLQRISNGPPDCVVSDHDMPGQNGIEFLETVREEYPDLPFILYTGKGSEEVASNALSAGATDYLQKGSGTDQYKLLANRIQNAVEQSRAQQRTVELERIRTLVGDINRALIRADSRSAVETRVCEILSESEPYLFAWIGEVAADTNHVEPRASAGVEEDYLDDITVTADETATGRGPGGTALRERRVAVSQDIAEDPEFPWPDAARDRGYRAVAAIPLEYKDTLYGALGVYADRPHAFDEDEQEELAELGADIGATIHSLERKQKQQELGRIKNFLEQIQKVATVGGWEIDLRTDSLRWTDEVYRIHDVDMDFEPRVEDGIEFYHPEDQATIQDAVERATTEGEPYDLELRIITADDEVRWVHTRGEPWYDDSEIVGVRGTFQDITERKERQRELEQIETLFQHAQDSLFLIDVADDFSIERVNPAWEDTTGLSAHQVRGQTPTELLGEKQGTAIEANYRECVESREPRQYEEQIQFDDELIQWETQIAPVVVDGTAEYIVGSTRDVTEQKEYEQEIEAQNKRLAEFASVVSHDLRNPLQVAVGGLELIRDECESVHIDDVAQALDRMDALIEDLLTLARVGEQVDETETVGLANAAKNSWQTVSTEQATLEADTSRAVGADRSRFRQLFENLYRNAVEHGGDGVTVHVGAMDDGFYVADTGPGIPESDREEVFKAGYSTNEDGTGLGLRIVEQVADAHGWEIAVTESEQGGARFEVTGAEFTDS
jgi:PAS domain S-box-containing protein